MFIVVWLLAFIVGGLLFDSLLVFAGVGSRPARETEAWQRLDKGGQAHVGASALAFTSQRC